MLGLDVRDAESFFSLLASNNDGRDVDIDNFVNGCMRLKGPATSIDIQALLYHSNFMHKVERRQHQDIMESMQELKEALGIAPAYDSRAYDSRTYESRAYESRGYDS